MTKNIVIVGLVCLLFPVASHAHETRMYEVNGVEYTLVVGSLGEPVIVDDKTGVDFRISRGGEPMVNAQENLQVEMIAGDKSRVENFSPVHGAEGQYKTNFIATIPTQLTYRLFGTLEDAPVNLVFTCNPAGHPQAEEDTSRVEVSDGVVQTLKRGSFSCPQPKEQLGFPEVVDSSYQMQQAVADLTVSEETNSNGSAVPMAFAALVASLLSSVLAYKAYSRK